MKSTTLALAAMLALPSSFAIAQTGAGAGAQGGATGVPGVKTNPTHDPATTTGTSDNTTGADTSGAANQGTGVNTVQSDKMHPGATSGSAGSSQNSPNGNNR
jgi:hypothetical protein